jgi:hypothetical protein
MSWPEPLGLLSIFAFGKSAGQGIESQTKKKTPQCGAVFLVQQLGKSLHEINDEIGRWRKVLDLPYQQHLAARLN